MSGASQPIISADERLARLRGIQEVEQQAEANVSRVAPKIELLRMFLANKHNQDLEDWLNAWDTANATEKNGERLREKLQSIATTLVPYVEPAEAWDSTREKQP